MFCSFVIAIFGRAEEQVAAFFVPTELPTLTDFSPWKPLTELFCPLLGSHVIRQVFSQTVFTYAVIPADFQRMLSVTAVSLEFSGINWAGMSTGQK